MKKQDIIDLYRKRAGNYDVTANLYYLIGFREWAYRRMAVDALGLRAGDRVVEIGCGTGLNFPLLERAVGPQGRIIGVDMTDTMLRKALERADANGWKNIELVQSDAALFKFPPDIDGVLSTFAITLVPEFDDIIRRGREALKPGKRWAILDFKLPTGLLSLAAPIGIFITRPFGVRRDLTNRKPWESISKHLTNTSMTELYGGFSYLAVGQRDAKTDPP